MTSANDTFWHPHFQGGRVTELDPTECRRLLVTTNVGRLGYSTTEAQQIVPMNYVVAENHIIVRTSPDNDVARFVLHRPVAFEVDKLEESSQSGWSVLVSGVAEEMPRTALRAMDVGDMPEPWVPGMRSLYLQIPVTSISGRRIHQDSRLA